MSTVASLKSEILILKDTERAKKDIYFDLLVIDNFFSKVAKEYYLITTKTCQFGKEITKLIALWARLLRLIQIFTQ